MGSQPSLLGNPPFHLLVPQTVTQTRPPNAVYYNQFDTSGPLSNVPNQFLPNQPLTPTVCEQVPSDQFTCPDTPVFGLLSSFIGRDTSSESSISADGNVVEWNKFSITPTPPTGSF